jgi:O-antigen/teichoic acid export membrane protein
MTFPVVLDLVISGAFVLAAFLFYLIKKGNNKRRRENGMHEGLIKVESFRLWLVIFSLIIFALKYFFSFVNSF